ncbi:MAG: hypothetical protein V8S98_05650 [Lachnospiraceae bacterium]
MGLWYGMMPWFAKIGIQRHYMCTADIFLDGIATYVFCMLTMVYVNDKMNKPFCGVKTVKI